PPGSNRCRRSTCRPRWTWSTCTPTARAPAPTCPRWCRQFPACWPATARTAPRTPSCRSAASARARPSACAACAGMPSASPRAGPALSEWGSATPGPRARARPNRAQDTQLSIRGFGARSTFGVRGVRLYADGIPATMPDGQGQVSHFALAAGDRIEVMRGPFSALYGNSSGGVVQLWSADGTPAPSLDLRATAGRYGHLAGSARLRGTAGGNGYNVSAQVLDSDGYREHSEARRTSLNARVHRELEGGGRIELVGNHF